MQFLKHDPFLPSPVNNNDKRRYLIFQIPYKTSSTLRLSSFVKLNYSPTLSFESQSKEIIIHRINHPYLHAFLRPSFHPPPLERGGVQERKKRLGKKLKETINTIETKRIKGDCRGWFHTGVKEKEVGRSVGRLKGGKPLPPPPPFVSQVEFEGRSQTATFFQRSLQRN